MPDTYAVPPEQNPDGSHDQEAGMGLAQGEQAVEERGARPVMCTSDHVDSPWMGRGTTSGAQKLFVCLSIGTPKNLISRV